MILSSTVPLGNVVGMCSDQKQPDNFRQNLAKFADTKMTHKR